MRASYALPGVFEPVVSNGRVLVDGALVNPVPVSVCRAYEQRRVNVDFPAWMVERLDREAGRLGVTRQSVIKMWIAERLK